MVLRHSLAFFLVFYTTFGLAVPLQPSQKHSLATKIITQVIESHHYKKVVLDDNMSKEIWRRYLDALDPNHTTFLKSDIDGFARYKTTLDDALLKQDLEPAFEIFNLYEKRLGERVDFSIQRLDHRYDFSVDEVYVFDRQNAEWPADQQEWNKFWDQRVKNDVLSLKLAGKQSKEIKETLRKRYERMIRNINQSKEEDVFQLFMNAYTQSIEPHTAYFSPRTSENFKINMSLKLEGIGAALSSDNEYTVVQRVIKGGPADLSGQLQMDDKIIGVAQGKNGKIEDVVGYRLSDVVELIRGPKGSIVRLQVLSKAAGPEGKAKTITLVRNEIKLEESAAKSSIIEIPGKNLRIGVIDVPAFYMDFEGRARGDEDFRSTTRDVQVLLQKLKKEPIDGLIIDLRGNGGGSLVEATSLTGLFVDSGPIVQVKQASGEIKVNADSDPGSEYDGPLAVLVDRYSASASEIFAGAIQDYRRGLIIGEPTFGKGTVQTLVDLNIWVRQPIGDLGQLKITMAQFFRINGDSTQFRGVVPDIAFPTASSSDKEGERGLDNALPWAHIKATKFTLNAMREDSLRDVHNSYEEREQKDSRFKLLREQSQRHDEAMKRVSISLQESKRRKEKEQLEKEQDRDERQFRIALGLDPNVKAKRQAREEDESDEDDVISQFLLKETAEILADYVTFSRQRTIVQNKNPTVQ